MQNRLLQEQVRERIQEAEKPPGSDSSARSRVPDTFAHMQRRLVQDRLRSVDELPTMPGM